MFVFVCDHECVAIFIRVCAYVAILFLCLCVCVCVTTIKENKHPTPANKNVDDFKFTQRMFYMLENTLIVGIRTFLFLINFFSGSR